MDYVVMITGTLLLPFLCITFVMNSVYLAKKIHKGDHKTAKNTFWVTVTFTMIVCSIAWMPFVE